MLWNSSVCFVVISVVVQPGDQLLSPERRTSTPSLPERTAWIQTHRVSLGVVSLTSSLRGLESHS